MHLIKLKTYATLIKIQSVDIMSQLYKNKLSFHIHECFILLQKVLKADVVGVWWWVDATLVTGYLL